MGRVWRGKEGGEENGRATNTWPVSHLPPCMPPRPAPGITGAPVGGSETKPCNAGSQKRGNWYYVGKLPVCTSPLALPPTSSWASRGQVRVRKEMKMVCVAAAWYRNIDGPLSHELQACGARRMDGGCFNSRSGVWDTHLQKHGVAVRFQDQAGVWVWGPGQPFLPPSPSSRPESSRPFTQLTPRHTGIQATSCLGN